jgi:hypothetical protein
MLAAFTQYKKASQERISYLIAYLENEKENKPDDVEIENLLEGALMEQVGLDKNAYLHYQRSKHPFAKVLIKGLAIQYLVLLEICSLKQDITKNRTVEPGETSNPVEEKSSMTLQPDTFKVFKILNQFFKTSSDEIITLNYLKSMIDFKGSKIRLELENLKEVDLISLEDTDESLVIRMSEKSAKILVEKQVDTPSVEQQKSKSVTLPPITELFDIADNKKIPESRNKVML